MPGALRMGLHKLLTSLHLEAHSNARLMTQKEFIIPMCFDGQEDLSLFRTDLPSQDPSSQVREYIPLLGRSVSIRTKIQLDEAYK